MFGRKKKIGDRTFLDYDTKLIKALIITEELLGMTKKYDFSNIPDSLVETISGLSIRSSLLASRIEALRNSSPKRQKDAI